MILQDTDTRRIYACHLELQDYLVHRDGKEFSREDYRQHPERFESTFHEKVCPYSPRSRKREAESLTYHRSDCSLHNPFPQWWFLFERLSSSPLDEAACGIASKP